MITARPLDYPFLAAAVCVVPPMDVDAFKPKAWGVDGITDVFIPIFADTGAHFISDGIVPGDRLMIHSALPAYHGTVVVTAVPDETYIEVGPPWPDFYTNCVYKVGKGPLHTVESLAAIIHARRLHAYTLKFHTLWTTADIYTFDRTHLGEVYCIS